MNLARTSRCTVGCAEITHTDELWLKGGKRPPPQDFSLTKKKRAVYSKGHSRSLLRTENSLTTDIFVVKYTGRGLVEKRPGALSKGTHINFIGGIFWVKKGVPNLVALYRAMRLRFGYGFESCDANGPRNVKNTYLAKHRPVVLPPLVGGKALVLKVSKRAQFHAAIRVTIRRCDSCAQGALSTRETDGIAAKLLRCGIASEALRRSMPLRARLKFSSKIEHFKRDRFFSMISCRRPLLMSHALIWTTWGDMENSVKQAGETPANRALMPALLGA